MSTDRLMTTRSLAEYLDYRGPNATISAWKWLKRTGIPKRSRGKAWLVKQSDVDRSLNGEQLKPRVKPQAQESR